MLGTCCSARRTRFGSVMAEASGAPVAAFSADASRDEARNLITKAAKTHSARTESMAGQVRARFETLTARRLVDGGAAGCGRASDFTVSSADGPASVSVIACIYFSLSVVNHPCGPLFS